MTKFLTFLLDDRRNDREWRMPLDVIRTTKERWVGTYGILHEKCDIEGCDYEHNEGATLEQALKKSKDAAVTRIVDVELDGNTL